MTNQGLFFGGKALLFLALFLSAPGITRGGGFQMVDQSARAMGIGGAVGALIGDPTIGVSPTTVRVPVVNGHSESVYVEFHRPMSAAEASAAVA